MMDGVRAHTSQRARAFDAAATKLLRILRYSLAGPASLWPHVCGEWDQLHARRGSSRAAVVCVLLLLGLAESGTVAANVKSSAYKLGPDDVIAVAVLRHPELSGDYLVPPDGRVELPHIGQLQVDGKTTAEVSAMITSSLGKVLRTPDVAVSLKTARPQFIYVMGKVGNAGSYKMEPGWRITEAVSAAGGLVKEIEETDCVVTVIRAATGAVDKVPYRDATRGGPERNLPLRVGDVVSVEGVDTLPVYVLGKVKNPGFYSMRGDAAGIMEAISLAGGVLDDAALSKVAVTHSSGQVETVDLVQHTVIGGQPSNLRLQRGDLVVVPDSTARIAVLGWVNRPGVLAVKESQTITLCDAIALGDGVDNKRADTSKVALFRMTDGKQQRSTVDLSKFLKSGDPSQNPRLLPGDVVWVPEKGRPEANTVFSAMSAIGLIMSPLLGRR